MENEKFVFEESASLINKLSESDEPQWGKMTAQHMIEHLGVIFMISADRINTGGLPKEQQEQYYRKLMSGNSIFKPNTKSPVLPKEPLPLRFSNLQEAKQAALKGLNLFKGKFVDSPKAVVEHPVFGPLNYEEWLHFHNMHLKHHFRQFDLISAE